MIKPLDGVRVLDLTRLLPGAICTLMLADLGAEVIKVESPDGGDYARTMSPMLNEMGAYFQTTNRAKKSITLNLKTEAGQAALHRLAQTADVLVESFRPGVVTRLKCDYETMKAVNPRLVYCAISGWGQTGEYAQTSGHDLNYSALSGLIGELNSPQPLGGQVADVGGAYVAVSGILAALLRRERTAEGGYIDASLFESAIPFGAYPWVESVMATRGAADRPRGVLSGKYACYNIYTTRDKQPVALAALEPHFWANFCNAIERPDLIDAYMSPARQPYLTTELQQIFAMQPCADWDAKLIPADCCYSRVHTPEDLLTNRHVHQRGLLDVGADGVPFMRSPIRLDGVEPSHGQAPKQGEHTEQVLRAAGFSDDEIAALT